MYGFAMQLTESKAIAPNLTHLADVDSTNLELARRNSVSALPTWSVLAASLQSAGQGRMGRTWVSEPETSLSVSVLLRPKDQKSAPWATLAAAVSVRHAIAHLGVEDAKVKWPNDVLVNGQKISGILAQLQPDNSVVLGVGINIRNQTGAPETATSLEALGLSVGFDQLLAAFLTAFKTRWDIFEQSHVVGADKTRRELIEHSATIGLKVRAILPDQTEIIGDAADIDTDGRLVINTPTPKVLAAADVWHLRN